MESERNACFQKGCAVCQLASETGLLPPPLNVTVGLQINQHSVLHFIFATINWYPEAMEPLRHNNIYSLTKHLCYINRREVKWIWIHNYFRRWRKDKSFHIPGNQCFHFHDISLSPRKLKPVNLTIFTARWEVTWTFQIQATLSFPSHILHRT